MQYGKAIYDVVALRALKAFYRIDRDALRYANGSVVVRMPRDERRDSLAYSRDLVAIRQDDAQSLTSIKRVSCTEVNAKSLASYDSRL